MPPDFGAGLSAFGRQPLFIRAKVQPMSDRTIDRQVKRTREALMRALTSLMFQRGFENVSVNRIVAEANVGRSTFYEHFKNKEDILAACMTPFFSVLADAAVSPTPPARLEAVLSHFWERRKLADAVFSGAARLVIARLLTQLIEERLATLANGAGKTAIPSHLAAVQLAEAELALLVAWLRGKARCSAATLTQALHASAYASARALSGASSIKPLRGA